MKTDHEEPFERATLAIHQLAKSVLEAAADCTAHFNRHSLAAAYQEPASIYAIYSNWLYLFMHVAARLTSSILSDWNIVGSAEIVYEMGRMLAQEVISDVHQNLFSASEINLGEFSAEFLRALNAVEAASYDKELFPEKSFQTNSVFGQASLAFGEFFGKSSNPAVMLEVEFFGRQSILDHKFHELSRTAALELVVARGCPTNTQRVETESGLSTRVPSQHTQEEYIISTAATPSGTWETAVFLIGETGVDPFSPLRVKRTTSLVQANAEHRWCEVAAELLPSQAWDNVTGKDLIYTER